MQNLIPYLVTVLLSTFIAWAPVRAESAKQSFDKGYRSHLNGNHANAAKYYTRAINGNPSFVQAYLMRAAAYHSQNQYERAIKDYTKVIELGEAYFKAVGYFNRGLVRYDVGKYKAAISDFTSALSFDEKMANAYLHRGIAKGRTGDRNGQVKDFANAARYGDYEVRQWLEQHAPHILERK